MAYSFQTFSVNQILTAAQMNQVEANIRDHVHGQNNVMELVAFGMIMPFAGAAADIPGRWFLCDGSAVSRTTYSDLFDAIGTIWGSGDGSTTFNIPDLRGRSLLGVNDSGLPNGESGSFSTRNEGDTGGEESHSLTSGENGVHGHQEYGSNGSGSRVAAKLRTDGSGTNTDTVTNTNVSPSVPGAALNTGSSGSATAHNTMHPFATTNYLIYHGVL